MVSMMNVMYQNKKLHTMTVYELMVIYCSTHRYAPVLLYIIIVPAKVMHRYKINTKCMYYVVSGVH